MIETSDFHDGIIVDVKTLLGRQKQERDVVFWRVRRPLIAGSNRMPNVTVGFGAQRRHLSLVDVCKRPFDQPIQT